MPEEHDQVAIVGMAVVLPGAPNLEAYWANIVSGHDAISDVPPARWDPIYYDPSSDAPDRFYCRRGGFVDDYADFDPFEFGVMPVAVDGAEPDQLLALKVASAALADAGFSGDEPIPGDTTGVILGRGGYLTPGVVRLDQRVRGSQQLVESLRTLIPQITEDQLNSVRLEYQRNLGPYHPEASIGLVPNLAASRIANRLDLRGPAYTVDAACASSLVAVDQACGELASRRCDLMLAGGVHLCHDPTFWSVFTQLGALSHGGEIRPFDSGADGILIGEGTAIMVLERLEDAEAAGRRIYAVIRGTGIASDGRASSLMAPRTDGQVLALERAWKRSGLDPATVGLIEAHGTATLAGDASEIATLRQVFGDGGAPVALGSVKSMIGHTMPAAGAAGLVKAALSLYNRVLPPTLHCENPHQDLQGSRLRTLSKAEPWAAGSAPRRAGVNAFGFGGIDAHVVLQEHLIPSDQPSRPRPRNSTSAMTPATTRSPRTFSSRIDRTLMIAAGDCGELAARLASLGEREGEATSLSVPLGSGPCRIAIVDPNKTKLELARRVVERAQTDTTKAWRGRNDVWFEPEGLIGAGGKIAFCFPGIEIGFEPDVAEIAEHFSIPLPQFGDPSDLEQQGFGVISLGRFLLSAFEKIGVTPDVLAGHSIGEWSAMIAAQVVPVGEIDEFIAGLKPGSLEVPGMLFAALGCGAGIATEAIADADASAAGGTAVVVSHDNCPHQSIICGPELEVRTVIEVLRRRSVLAQELPFRSGFHSPHLAEFLGPFKDHLSNLTIQAPKKVLYSATTTAPYPSDPAEIRALVLRHLLEPVRFGPMTEVLYDDGVRAFVQVGLGSLTGFIDDTLKGRPSLAIAALAPKHTGMAQFGRAAAGLWVQGVPVKFEDLGGGESFRTSPQATLQRSSDHSSPLVLGVPLVRFESPLVLATDSRLAVRDGVGDLAGPSLTSPSQGSPSQGSPSQGSPSLTGTADPILIELEALLSETALATSEVVLAWRASTSPGPPATFDASYPRTKNQLKTFSVDAFPELADHCFYRQPPGWPEMSDRFPVVPMTMLIELMAQAAMDLVPGREVVAIEDIRAFRWLAVAPPVEANITASAEDPGRVRVTIEGFADASVLLADDFSSSPVPDMLPFENERPAPVPSDRLYMDRWMFHDARYQGVIDLGPLSDSGIRGTLRTPPGMGALLDNAGQLMGYWVMERTQVDRLALPVRIDRIDFFGPHPAVGEELACKVRVTAFDDVLIRTDMAIVRAATNGQSAGSAWATISGWEDRRFDSDAPWWEVLRYPESNMLLEPVGGGGITEPGIAAEHWRSSASRDLAMRRYLGESERTKYLSMNPKAQRQWLLGRIAAKDVIRRWLSAHGHGPIFPVEIQIDSDHQGRPIINASGSLKADIADLRVSIAHTEWLGVAIAGQGVDVGVDIERIEPRGEGFAGIALTEEELVICPRGPRRAEWLTRFWVAKESAAKAAGTGLEGNPRAFVISKISREALLVTVAGPPRVERWIETRRHGEYVVGWTRP